jgi:hypothetical protein
MKPVREMTEAELAAFVGQHLRERGIRVVLSGGMCVTIYARNAYVSGDLDFVPEVFVDRRKVSAALLEIGFEHHGRLFKHPESPVWVDIRTPPLAVGREPVKQICELVFPTGTLRLISPTDCAKDRLANYYYFNDRQCLEQARLVVEHCDVDLAEAERWSAQEGQEARFAQVKESLLEAERHRKQRSAARQTE